MRKQNVCLKIILFFMIFLESISNGMFHIDIHIQAARKLHIETDTGNAEETQIQLKVGKTIQLNVNVKDPVYRSSDSTIACVNEDGKVTGKKGGSVIITVEKNGFMTEKVKVIVVKKKKMPVLPVAVDEVTIEDASLQEDKNGDIIFSAMVENHAKNRKIKQVVLTYQAEIAQRTVEYEQVPVTVYDNITGGSIESVTKTAIEEVTKAAIEEVTKAAIEEVTKAAIEEVTKAAIEEVSITKKVVSLVFKNISAGKKSERVFYEENISGDIDCMKLKKIEVYSGDAVHIYSVEKDNYDYDWGTEDNKAPKITGWIGKDSVSKGEPFRVYYSDRQKDYNFKQYVKADDERAGKVKLTVDISEINWKKAGIYKIRYKAKDKAGNVAKAWAKVEVRMADTAAEIADKILLSITKNEWSNERKARAIYSYVKSHCTYIGHSTHADWSKVAVNAFRYGSGDCFTFYSMAKALLTRAGIPNIAITRYPLLNGARHWWNLVYVRGGWYHFDTTPRSIRGYFCLVTDRQLREYRNSSAFQYTSSDYPKRAVKTISHGCNQV